MGYKIYVLPQANIDIYESVEWYEKQRTGLGYEFYDAVELMYQKIAKLPQSNGFIDEKKVYREALMKRFPFLIIYKIEEDSIIINSVHHSKKHPNKKIR